MGSSRVAGALKNEHKLFTCWKAFCGDFALYFIACSIYMHLHSLKWSIPVSLFSAGVLTEVCCATLSRTFKNNTLHLATLESFHLQQLRQLLSCRIWGDAGMPSSIVITRVQCSLRFSSMGVLLCSALQYLRTGCLTGRQPAICKSDELVSEKQKRHLLSVLETRGVLSVRPNAFIKASMQHRELLGRCHARR